MPLLLHAATLLLALAAVGFVPNLPAAAQAAKSDKGKESDLFSDTKNSGRSTSRSPRRSSRPCSRRRQAGLASAFLHRQELAETEERGRPRGAPQCLWSRSAMGGGDDRGRWRAPGEHRDSLQGERHDHGRGADDQEVHQVRPRPPRPDEAVSRLKTLNLHSGVADPRRRRETLGYSAYRAAGVPAPRTSTGRSHSHRAGEVRQGVPRPLHDRRTDGQGIPQERITRPTRASDEAGAAWAGSTSWAMTGRLQGHLSAEARRDAGRTAARHRLHPLRQCSQRRAIPQGDRLVSSTWTPSCVSWPSPPSK